MENEASEIKKPARDDHGRLLPGNTGNPNGRPTGSLSLVHHLRAELKKQVIEKTSTGTETHEEKVLRAVRLIRKILTQAEKGDRHSQKLIMNYIDGLPKANLDVTSGGKPIPILGNVSAHDFDQENSETQ